MRRPYAVVFFFFALVQLAVTQETPQVDVFAGYSYARLGFKYSSSSAMLRENANGWEGTLNINLSEGGSIVADFSGHYSDLHKVHLFLFGPRYTVRKDKVQPFLQALLGAAHWDRNETGVCLAVVGFPCPSERIHVKDTGFALALGAGADVRLNQRVSLRLISADYLRTQIFDRGENHVRLSTGIVFHFGQR